MDAFRILWIGGPDRKAMPVYSPDPRLGIATEAGTKRCITDVYSRGRQIRLRLAVLRRFVVRSLGEKRAL